MSAAKSHCSLHTMTKAIPVAMKGEIEAVGIWTSGTTLHIKPGVDLPMALLDKVLRARLAELECRYRRRRPKRCSESSAVRSLHADFGEGPVGARIDRPRSGGQVACIC